MPEQSFLLTRIKVIVEDIAVDISRWRRRRLDNHILVLFLTSDWRRSLKFERSCSSLFNLVISNHVIT